MDKKRKLVAYFSATGTTEKAAKELSKILGADLYEIEPLVPYTNEDLNWRNSQSRSSLEMKDYNIRPAIKTKLKNTDIEKYEKIYLGFPIWWYVAPTIINTFLENYNFSEKTIVLFATSGGSGFGNTIQSLEKSTGKNVKIIESKVLKEFWNKKDIENIAEF